MERLFHISENPDIAIFKPRPSPTHYEQLKGDVVFAVSEEFLHNYFFPRDCPRVGYYRDFQTSHQHAEDFFTTSYADYILTVENSWYNKIRNVVLYCYEFSPQTFDLLDKNAGYYISSETITPISIRRIDDPINELLSRNIELRFTPNLWKLAELLKNSDMNFSMIRMRNAQSKP